MTARKTGQLVLVPSEDGRVSWELQLGTVAVTPGATYRDENEAMRDAEREASRLGLGIASVTDHWGNLVVLS